jgi:hypothetical protein
MSAAAAEKYGVCGMLAARWRIRWFTTIRD